MEEKYKAGCDKMQQKMVAVLEQMSAKVKESQSPIDYLVILKKFDEIMKDIGPGIAILANAEFAELQKNSGDEPVIKMGATLIPCTPMHKYAYPDHIDQLKKILDKVRDEARKSGSAVKGDRTSKRNFKISFKPIASKSPEGNQ